MPAKNSIGKFHGRYALLSRSLWRKYMRVTGKRIEYSEFRKIVVASMEEIRGWVIKEPIGYQFTPNFGNIAVSRFHPEKSLKDWSKTSLGPIVHHNLHTGGDVFTIRWFHGLATHKSRQPYWFFKASRSFNRELAVVLKGRNRPNFNSYMQNHFINRKYNGVA